MPQSRKISRVSIFLSLRTLSFLVVLFLQPFLFSQVSYNHPEIEWQSFETDHFVINFYDGTERTAREGAAVAETIYPFVTNVYDYETPAKTHITFLDTDDFSNGAAYYYDNKIEIWASPLDYDLRGSHRWLQDVITHEFTHIISLQKAMKFGRNIPGAYFQWIGYEKEKREDVLYGYPNTLVSYPVPGTAVPPWLAEGTAQYMFEGATYDFWDSHRDMILRDRVLHGNLLSFTEMSTFGKSGIGNESTYNSGFALVKFIAKRYGDDALRKIMVELSKPFQYSINSAIKKAVGKSGKEVYSEFKLSLKKHYHDRMSTVFDSEQRGRIIEGEGTTNIHPVWSHDGEKFAFLSNKKNDFFSQTDLYIYDLKAETSEKIVDGVLSAPTWSANDSLFFYSKKSKPDRHGSKWYDLYQYSIEDEEEERLTKGARALSPVVLNDSLLAYLAVEDGTHNVFLVNLNSRESEKITDFDNGRQIFGLSYEPEKNWLIFDFVESHFRNTATLSLSDTLFTDLISTAEWDERDVTPIPNGGLIYANDKSGVFNLYMMDMSTGRQGYITNVTGGAFMPDVGNDGQILYSLYEDGGYKIAILDSVKVIPEEVVGYGPDHFAMFANLPAPIIEQLQTKAKSAIDSFGPMFVFPKLMMDYGTWKPGFYFYSNEILNRLNVFGGASVNSLRDVDLFLIFEFKRFYPTLYTEIFYLTRNVYENEQWRDTYDLGYDINFRLFQWDAGLRFPIKGSHELKLYGSFQQFHEGIKERVVGQLGKLGFDYYIGKHFGIAWQTNIRKPTVDYGINPGNGIRGNLEARYEKDDFIDGFKINKNYSTLEADFITYEFWRITGDLTAHVTLPWLPRWTASAELQWGWMSSTEVDSFFNFFTGGLPGLKGYPFYSIEGNREVMGELSLRVPLFREKHYPVGPFILQNIIMGVVAQAGDAWNGAGDEFSLKRSVGAQLRFGGFSFYNYPTGIGMEIHKGLDKFSIDGNDYGNELRTYFTLLFGF